jgi:glycosyltransferase involved in cell wall biosynthesis
MLLSLGGGFRGLVLAFWLLSWLPMTRQLVISPALCNCADDSSPGKPGLSIVIMNYNRPHNLKKSLPELSALQAVDEIVVAHCHPSYALNDSYPKVKYEFMYDWDAELGAGMRTLIPFSYDKVLYLDDDLVIESKLLDQLLTAQATNDADGFYGPLGRICNPRLGYELLEKVLLTKPWINDLVNVILTPVLLTSRRFVATFNARFDKLYRAKLRSTHGNGEDLCMNHFLVNYFQLQPMQVGLLEDIHYLDNKGGYSTAGGRRHLELRSGFCRWLGTVDVQS